MESGSVDKTPWCWVWRWLRACQGLDLVSSPLQYEGWAVVFRHRERNLETLLHIDTVEVGRARYWTSITIGREENILISSMIEYILT